MNNINIQKITISSFNLIGYRTYKPTFHSFFSQKLWQLKNYVYLQSIQTTFPKTTKTKLKEISIAQTEKLRYILEKKNTLELSKTCSYPLSQTLEHCLLKNFQYQQIPENLSESKILNVEKFNNSINLTTQQSIWYQVTFLISDVKKQNSLIVTLERKKIQNDPNNVWRVAHYEHKDWDYV